MTKRSRDADEVDELVKAAVKDELVKAAVKEALKKLKTDPNNGGAGGDEKSTSKSIANLTQQFNNVLRDIIREEGVVGTQLDEDVMQFTAYLQYPNEIDVETTQNDLLRVDDGVAWIKYEATKVREMKLAIFYTNNKSLKMQYLASEQREAQRLLKEAKHTTDKQTEADMVLFSLMSNLLIDSSQKPLIQSRPSSGEGVHIISVTVAAQSPLKNHQVSRVSAGQARKIKSLRIGPHPSAPTIRMTVEIFCSNLLNGDLPPLLPPQQKEE
jgi:hypothetical protein